MAATTVRSRSRRPCAVLSPGASANSVGGSTPQVCRADNRAKHAARSACSLGARLVLHVTKRARATCHGTSKRWLRSFEAQPPTKRGVGTKGPQPTAWGGARRELAALSTAPSPQLAVRALWALGWFSTGTSRARAARHGIRKRRLRRFEAAAADRARNRRQEPRPTAWGGASRELAAQKTAPSTQRTARAPWAVRWFSTGRSAHGPRDAEL